MNLSYRKNYSNAVVLILHVFHYQVAVVDINKSAFEIHFPTK